MEPYCKKPIFRQAFVSMLGEFGHIRGIVINWWFGCNASFIRSVSTLSGAWLREKKKQRNSMMKWTTTSHHESTSKWIKIMRLRENSNYRWNTDWSWVCRWFHQLKFPIKFLEYNVHNIYELHVRVSA